MTAAAADTRRVVAVAFSGGRDSSALLHATQVAAGVLGIEVLALHVNHGLSAAAGDWEAHCRAQCQRFGTAIAVARLTAGPPPGDSVEAWARSARYAALRRLALAGGARLVLLGHHQRDQAETLLLQALRGGGLAGLAGMPRQVQRQGITWARPWLDVSRASIDAYVAGHGIAHVDDDSNADRRFARNRLRLDLWPALTAAFPQAESALATAAGWAQQAMACLDELAAFDLAALDAASPAAATALALREWQALSTPRRSLALRAWLRRATGQGAPASLVERLLHELPVLTSARWQCGEQWLCSHRGLLRLYPASRHLAIQPAAVAALPADRCQTIAIRRAGRFRLAGWPGCWLLATRVAEGGVPLAWLAHIEIRPRSGGERFQPAPGRPARSLKKQFQAAGVAVWQRDGPLLFSGGQLVFVPGLGIDARMLALPGQPQLSLQWLPADDAVPGTVGAPAKIEG